MATREQRWSSAHASAAPLGAVREFASAHALALIVVLAAAVRFATLGTPTFWFDESLTANETRDGLVALFHAVRGVEVNPPLYFVVAWGWQKVLGDSEIALRSLSALLGTATVPVVYAAARELASRRAGLIAAALTATNPLLIWYSQEARTYPLLVFLSALSFVFFAYSLNREEPRWLWAWAVASGLALATHYFALMLLVPEAIWLLLRARAPRVKALLACAGVGCAGLALLPLYAAQQDHQVTPGGWITYLDRSDRLLALPQQFVAGLSVPWRALPALIGGGLVVAVVYALIRADRRSQRAFALAGGVGLAGMLLAILPAFFGHDYLITRNVIELWLPLAVAVAVALGARAIGWLGPAVVLALGAIGLVLSIWNTATPAAGRVDWDAVASALGEPQRERVIGAPGFLEGAPLSLQLTGAHVAKPGERIAASELVLLSMREVPNYGIGPCVWGADCGGTTLGGSGPPFGAPPHFRLVEQGSTPRVTYRIYRAPRPVRFPAPKPNGQRNIVVQAPR
jgi:mannosyltransferase